MDWFLYDNGLRYERVKFEDVIQLLLKVNNGNTRKRCEIREIKIFIERIDI